MKTRVIIIAALFAAAAAAVQNPVTFERKFKEGEKDDYRVSLVVSTAMGDAEIQMTLTQTVKKVYDSGSADLENTTTDLKVAFNGQEVNVPASQVPASTTKVDKYGMPIGKANAPGSPLNFGFLRYATLLPSTGVKLGETVNIDHKDPDNPKNTVSGTVRFEGVTDGVAKVISKLEISNDQSASPMKVVLTSWIDQSTNKVTKAEGTASNLPSQGGMQVNSVQFHMEMKK